MAGLFSVRVNDKAFRSYLDRLQGRMSDMTPVMSEIGAVLESRVSGRFETETDPSGTPWAPWAQSTRENYPDDGNGRILDRYGDLLASLNWQANASSVRVGFGQPYAAYHEWGTSRMPQRGLLMDDPDAGTLAPDDERLVLDLLVGWLDGA